MAEYSQFVNVAPHRWHIQKFGQGPLALLLHGAGGATQSFRHLAPLLSKYFTVCLIDLPGQGFTRLGTRSRSGLPETTSDIQKLLEHENLVPEIVIAHSAGATIALSMAIELKTLPIVGINPALARFEGAAGWLFPILAKLLSVNPFIPGLFSRFSGSKKRVEGLLASTGSPLDPAGISLYQTLIQDKDHVDGTLLMMANWSIDSLVESLEKISAPVLFLTGSRDGAVPSKVASSAAQRLVNARLKSFDGQGHLLHETAPKLVAEAIIEFSRETGVLQSLSA